MDVKVVFHDEHYPSSWISNRREIRSGVLLRENVTKKIRDHLVRKKFEEKNSVELLEWFRDIISNRMAHKSVVVFSQDVFPETVFPSDVSDVIVRKYLDVGGKIVWMGDVPFWYRGIDERRVAQMDEQKRKKAFVDESGVQQAWMYIPFISILGIIPVFATISEPVSLTGLSEKMGLKTIWYGTRPIAIKHHSHFRLRHLYHGIMDRLGQVSNHSRSFIKNEREKLAFASMYSLPKHSSFKVLAFGRAITAKHLIKKASRFARIRGIGAAGFSVNVGFSPGEEPLIEWDKEYVCAFLINFNREHPYQGFIRIWDFPLNGITSSMLDELYDVANYQLS